MKLYYAPGACSLAAHVLLRETAMPFALVRVDTSTHKTADGGDYYAINPKGAVPVLELDDGARFTEGPIIGQYICDRAARTDLMPAAGSMQRYRVMEWQNYVTSELHKSFSPLFNPALDAGGKALFRASLRKKYEWVGQQLASDNFLTGNTFTAADAYLFAVTRWAGHVGLDLADLGAIQNLLQRINEREAVQAALRAEGLPLKQAA